MNPIFGLHISLISTNVEINTIGLLIPYFNLSSRATLRISTFPVQSVAVLPN